VSNLRLTQRIYDALDAEKCINPPDPINPALARSVTEEIIPQVVAEDGVAISQMLMRNDLSEMLQSLAAETSSEAGIRALLDEAFSSSRQYHDTWLVKTKAKNNTR